MAIYQLEHGRFHHENHDEIHGDVITRNGDVNRL